MSYIEQSLSSGESVLYRTRLHWVVMFAHLLFALLIGFGGIGLIAVAVHDREQYSDLCAELAKQGSSCPSQAPTRMGMEPNTYILVGVCLLGLAVVIVVFGLFKRSSTEMAVTNKRVLVKVGLMSRRSIEIMLSKIESVRVDQSVMGRILRFGTIVVRGVGGTPEPFADIANPLEFRRRVQEQIDRLQPEDAKSS
ncbi:MAG: PH domain-containing protein [Terriglobales bacterium]